MKVRNSFVSNSSNASFIISLMHLTEMQVRMIHNHATMCSMFGIDKPSREGDIWSIYINEEDYCIEGSTGMDNFDMWSYLKAMKIPEEIIKWSGN